MEVRSESSSEVQDHLETNLLEIPHNLLIDFISNSTLRLSSPLLNASICTFVLQHIGAKVSQVSKEGLTMLGARISKFLFVMRSRKAAKSRHFERVSLETWAEKKMTLPNDLFLTNKHRKEKSRNLQKEKSLDGPFVGLKSEKETICVTPI